MLVDDKMMRCDQNGAKCDYLTAESDLNHCAALT